jgi:hypothetical protein
MRNFIKIFSKANLSFVILLLAEPLLAQNNQYGKGAVLDEAVYNRLPHKALLATRDYDVLPQAVSLKPFAPSSGDQGSYGT